MKTRFLLFSLAATWLCLFAVTGCGRQPTPAPKAETAPAATNPPSAVVSASEPAEEPVEATPEPKPFPPARTLSPGVAEVVELAQARVSEPVMLEYIRAATNRLEIGAEDLVYLRDIGLSDPVLTAMMEQGRQQRVEARGGGEPEPEIIAPAVVTEIPPDAPGEVFLPSRGPSQTSVAGTPEANLAPTATSALPPAMAYAPATESVAPIPAESAEASQAAPTSVTYNNNYFYDALSPYGTWTEVAPYGMTWQPACSRLDPDWRPYCHGGRWVYTDSGWYWQSDYSWGWAPFHYGRWHRHTVHGWVWVPGRVWAPAWVAWREAEGYCGWAPLPPVAGWSFQYGVTWRSDGFYHGMAGGLGCDWFTFVSYRDFCHPSLHRHYLRDRHAVNIYGNSVVINNLVIRDRNTIVNHCITPQRITAVTRQEIAKVPLEDIHGSTGSKMRPDRIDPASGRLAVFRPKLPQSDNESPQDAGSIVSRSRQEPVKPSQTSRPQLTSLPAPAEPLPALSRRSVVEAPSKPLPSTPAGDRLDPRPPSVPGIVSRASTDVEKPLPVSLAGSPPPLTAVSPAPASPPKPPTASPAPSRGSDPKTPALPAAESPATRIVPSQSVPLPPAAKPLVATPPKIDRIEKPTAATQPVRTVEPKTPSLPQSVSRSGLGYAPLNPRPLPSSSDTSAARTANPAVTTPPTAVSRQVSPPPNPTVVRETSPHRAVPTTPSSRPSVSQSRSSYQSPAPSFAPPRAQTTLPAPEPRRQVTTTAPSTLPQRSASEALRSEPRKLEVAPPAYSAPKFADRPGRVDSGPRAVIPNSSSAPSSFSPPASSRSFAAPPASAGPARSFASPPPSPSSSRSFAPSAPAPAPRSVAPAPGRSSVVRDAGPSSSRSSGPPQSTRATPGGDARRGR